MLHTFEQRYTLETSVKIKFIIIIINKISDILLMSTAINFLTNATNDQSCHCICTVLQCFLSSLMDNQRKCQVGDYVEETKQ